MFLFNIQSHTTEFLQVKYERMVAGYNRSGI